MNQRFQPQQELSAPRKMYLSWHTNFLCAQQLVLSGAKASILLHARLLTECALLVDIF